MCVFTGLMLVAQPSEERQMGDQTIAAEDPDWRDVIAKAEAVLKVSHDLRAAVVLATARLRTHGFEGLAPVTRLYARMSGRSSGIPAIRNWTPTMTTIRPCGSTPCWDWPIRR
jgi:predicted component of type VI protein secretion system